MKGTAEGVRIWIEMTEMIFQQRDKNEKHHLNIKNWFFTQNKKWLRKAPQSSNYQKLVRWKEDPKGIREKLTWSGPGEHD